MSITMPLDDAAAIRKAFEPATIGMVSDDSLKRSMDPTDYTIAATSIAISLRRIADTLEKMQKRNEARR